MRVRYASRACLASRRGREWRQTCASPAPSRQEPGVEPPTPAPLVVLEAATMLPTTAGQTLQSPSLIPMPSSRHMGSPFWAGSGFGGLSAHLAFPPLAHAVATTDDPGPGPSLQPPSLPQTATHAQALLQAAWPLPGFDAEAIIQLRGEGGSATAR
jgi:hypothetical protein